MKPLRDFATEYRVDPRIVEDLISLFGFVTKMRGDVELLPPETEDAVIRVLGLEKAEC